MNIHGLAVNHTMMLTLNIVNVLGRTEICALNHENVLSNNLLGVRIVHHEVYVTEMYNNDVVCVSA